MKIGIVYTNTTPELKQFVNKELIKQLGNNFQHIDFEDPSILDEIRKAGYVTATAAARLVGGYTEAINAGADVILNCCSSVGEVVDSVQDFAKFTGVPIVKIDEEMCREAIRSGSRIGIMATLASTLNPTKNMLLRLSREMHKQTVLIDGLIDGAFGLSQDKFKEKMLEKAKDLAPLTDVLLFAQGSMAYSEEYIHQKTGKIVVSSPRFGAFAVRKALEALGLLKED